MPIQNELCWSVAITKWECGWPVQWNANTVSFREFVIGFKSLHSLFIVLLSLWKSADRSIRYMLNKLGSTDQNALITIYPVNK